MKAKLAVAAVAGLVLAAGVGALAALATASALDDGDERFARGDAPRFVLPDDEPRFDRLGPFGFDHPGFVVGALDLEAAAAYLGVDVDDLRDELADGSSLADAARDAGKSVDGLVDALVEAGEERIDEAVEDGRLSEEDADELKEDLEERIRDRVDDDFPRPFWFERDFERPRGRAG